VELHTVPQACKYWSGLKVVPEGKRGGGAFQVDLMAFGVVVEGWSCHQMKTRRSPGAKVIKTFFSLPLTKR
jgi:hypothetical protein